MAKRDLYLVVSEIRYGRKARFGALTLLKKPGANGVTLEEARRIGVGEIVENEEPLPYFHPDEERRGLVMNLDEGEILAHNMLRKIANARRIIALSEKKS
jgi:hypothetical protein